MKNGTPKIWITWEHQRRSITLSKAFGADYYELLSRHNRVIRYLYLSFKSLYIIIKTKPAILFVQNPSMILTFLSCIIKTFSKKMILVVDRHSNFFPITNSAFLNNLYERISNLTLQQSDLTIVTNNHLNQLVESSGGRSIVLEDKIPDLQRRNKLKLQGKNNLLYICSFDPDEPYQQVFKSASFIDSDTYIYVTGNFNKIREKRAITPPSGNLILLGYLSDDMYFEYLWAVDAVIVLTTWEHTLLCGAYEAVAAEKPLVLSDRADLVAYFNRGVVKTDNTAENLAQAIETVIKEKLGLKQDIIHLKSELNENWDLKFNQAQKLINAM